VGRGPLVGHGALLADRQSCFSHFNKNQNLDKNFIKIIKSLPYQLQKKQQNDEIFTQLKLGNKQNQCSKKPAHGGPQNFHISL
jgi:hypothetical protein